MKKESRKFDPDNDDRNWSILFNQHFQDMQSLGAISTLWINGFAKMGMDQSRRPHAKELTDIASKYTGFEFIQTDSNIILEQIEWYRLIAKKQMPLTNFVRTPEELHYCDEPDLWHDVMGHIPYLLEQEYVDMYCLLAETYIKAFESSNELALKELDFIGGLIIELGLLKESSGVKAFGATFYSSGEMFEAFKAQNQVPFDPANMAVEASYDRSEFQGRYFVFDSLDQLKGVIHKINARL